MPEQDKMDNSIEINDNGTPEQDNSQEQEDNIDYKSRYASSTKEYQKLSADYKQTIRDAEINKSFRKVLANNDYLLELDQDIAQEVVQQLYEDWYSDTDSLEELLEAIQSNSTDTATVKPVDEKALAKSIREQIKAEELEKQANEILDKKLSKYDEDVKNKYLEEFKEIIWDKKLTPELAKREIEKIIFYYNREDIKKEQADNALSKIASNSIWKTTKTQGSTTLTREKLTDMGMPLSDQKILYPELFSNNK